jgi:hypothetical protein
MQLARDIAAFTNVFGVEDADFVMTMATIPWKSEDDRNGFINEIIEINNGALYMNYPDEEGV